MTKLAAEQLCRVYHADDCVDAVALRFFTVYGPRRRPDMAFRRFCEAAARGAAIELYGDGRQSPSPTWSRRSSPPASGRASAGGSTTSVAARP